MGCSVVLDVGKTSAKLCALDASGERLVELRRANATIAGPPYPHLDMEGIFDWAIEGLARIAADFEIDAIVPVAHGATAALLAGDSLALPVLDYEFDGVTELDAEYEPLARDFARTRSPRLPAGLNLGRQLFWLERRFPAEFARVTDILLWPQYWAWRLSGANWSEVTSLGCHTDLWQAETNGFSRLARERGWTSLFPKLVPAWHRLGKVLAGIHDSNASYLVHRAARTRELAIDTARCLELLGAEGDVIVEGPFAQNATYCEAFETACAPRRVLVSSDSIGTVAGALLLARWSLEGR